MVSLKAMTNFQRNIRLAFLILYCAHQITSPIQGWAEIAAAGSLLAGISKTAAVSPGQKQNNPSDKSGKSSQHESDSSLDFLASQTLSLTSLTEEPPAPQEVRKKTLETAFKFLTSSRDKSFDTKTEYPFEGYGRRNYTQPTTIGFYIQVLANIISGEVVVKGLSAKTASQRLDKLMKNLLVHQQTLGFKGLLPWFSMSKSKKWQRYKGEPGDKVVFGDNANLSSSIGAALGALADPDIFPTTEIDNLKAQMETFLDAQAEGYDFLFDENQGQLRRGWNYVTNQWEGGPSAFHDYFGDEFRSGILFVILRYGFSESAYGKLAIQIEDYLSEAGETLYTVAPWDGGAFQMLWPTLTMPESKDAASLRMLQDFLAIALDFSRKKNLQGFLSATYEAIERYNGNVGIADVTINPVPRNEKTASLYPVGPAFMVDENQASQFLSDILKTVPGLTNSHGFWDAVTESGKIVKEQIGANMLSFILGVLGTGPDQMIRYLQGKNIYTRLQEIYAPGNSANIITGSTNVIKWGDADGSFVGGGSQYAITSIQFTSSGTAFIQNSLNISGRQLKIRYRSNSQQVNGKIEFKQVFGSGPNADRPIRAQINHILFEDTDGEEKEILINLPPTPGLWDIDEVVLLLTGGSGGNLVLTLTGLEII